MLVRAPFLLRFGQQRVDGLGKPIPVDDLLRPVHLFRVRVLFVGRALERVLHRLRQRVKPLRRLFAEHPESHFADGVLFSAVLHRMGIDRVAALCYTVVNGGSFFSLCMANFHGG